MSEIEHGAPTPYAPTAGAEFPKMLYRPGTSKKIWGMNLDTMIAGSAEEQDEALADGWGLTPSGDLPDVAPKPEAETLQALRHEFTTLTGKQPFNGWNEVILREKIAAAREAANAAPA